MKVNPKIYETTSQSNFGRVGDSVYNRIRQAGYYRNNYFDIIRHNIGRTYIFSMVRGVLNKKETYENK